MPWTMVLALSVFSYLCGIGFLISLVWTFNLDAHLKMVNPVAGVDLPALASRDRDARRALGFLSSQGSSQMLGLNLFALHVLWIPFRHLEPWAWWVMWFYPIMFVWHYLKYAKKTPLSYAQVVYFVLGGAALVLTYGEFF